MPLNAEAKRLVVELNRLGHAIGRACDDMGVAAVFIYAAMMRRVRLDERCPVHGPCEQRVRLDFDGMAGLRENARMAPLGHTLACPQAWNVHTERSARGDIEQLCAAAGGEQGLIRLQHFLDELELK